MLGETASETGFYDVIAVIAMISLGLAGLDLALRRQPRSSPRTKYRWALPVVNILIAVGLLAIIATPWAYFNIGHPVSDRIYQVRNVIAPSTGFERSSLLRPNYFIDPAIWRCDDGPCEGDPNDTLSIYHHRYLELSFRFVLFSECMTPVFNIATADAIGTNTTNWDGDRRKTARAFFDKEGRFIGPHYDWFNTPLMRSQLTDQEKRSSPISLDHLLTRLSAWSPEFGSPHEMPKWVDWETLEKAIKSGETLAIHRTDDLLIGVRLNDGTEMIGTQTRVSDLDRILEECGSDCDGVQMRR